ncbi:MAG: hypothetical protein Q9195_003034 [Heterodermia aff. obscurata]
MAPGKEAQRVVVVGAGPVGALAAIYAATRGDTVEVYELRADLRDPSTTPLNFTKSINLALSERGINAMRAASADNLLDEVLDETIPMHGRMIHGRRKNGQLFQEPQAYDVHGRFIRAADRAVLNKRLLDALEKMPNVKFFFNHKLVGADFNANTAWFEQRDRAKRTDHAQNPTSNDRSASEHEDSTSSRAREITVKFDFLIGADGAHSATRYHLMKYAQLSYQQEYIDALWCEFHINPRPPDSSFAISPNHLHIWPGTSFMFIAIPSNDKSFTCTLFAPSTCFSSLSQDPETSLAAFFAENFPGVCPDLISPKALLQQFRDNPHLPLISIKCTPYHYKSSAVILGDAAHAMVPFYGQGMNAGLEDVRVLFGFLDRHGVYDPASSSSSSQARRSEALAQYTSQRTPDAAAINELALRNYEEMRAGVVSPLYKARKYVEEGISRYAPGLGFATQYSRVSFGNERYSEVVRAVEWQADVLIGLGRGTALAIFVGSVVWLLRGRIRAFRGS